MTKEELIKDMKFRQKCGQYGLDWEEDIIGISQDAILLNKAGAPWNLWDLFEAFEAEYKEWSHLLP